MQISFDIDKVAEAMYTAYCNDASWRSVNDEVLPDWWQLPWKIKDHWREAAVAGIGTFTTEIGNAHLEV